MKLASGKVLRSATRLSVKVVVVVAAAIGGGALVSSSVFASLTAVASANTSVEAGTLKWEQAASSGAGFSSGISGAAPGDTFNRYVTITNSGSLNGITPTVTVVPTGGSALVAILKVYIQGCTLAWAGGNCTSPTAVLGSAVAPVSVSTLTSTGLSNLLTASAAINYLKISVVIGDATEVTLNGVTPAGIQGLGNATTLAWSFGLTQRAGTVVEG